MKNAFRAAQYLIKPMIDQRELKRKGYDTIDGLSMLMREQLRALKSALEDDGDANIHVAEEEDGESLEHLVLDPTS